MKMRATLKRNKDNMEVNVFQGNEKRSSYNNTITRDPNILAQILLDLELLGFPIRKAIKIMKERIKNHDWMGV